MTEENSAMDWLIEVQQCFKSLTEENFSDEFSQILGLLSPINQDIRKRLAHEILWIPPTRVTLDEFLIKFIAQVLIKIDHTEEMKSYLLEEILLDRDIKIKMGQFYLIKKLTDYKVFSVKEIENFITFYPQTTRPELYSLFFTFAPILEKNGADIYDILEDKFYGRLFFDQFDAININLKSYKEDNWVKFNLLLDKHAAPGSIQHILKTDDVSSLQDYCVKMSLSFDLPIFFSPFCYHHLLESAKPIEIAAFFGSVKCFKYLLMQKAEISISLPQYASAGGNIEIIRLTEQNGGVFDEKALACAAIFRNYDIFEWIRIQRVFEEKDLQYALEVSTLWGSAKAVKYLVEDIKGTEQCYSNASLMNHHIISKYVSKC